MTGTALNLDEKRSRQVRPQSWFVPFMGTVMQTIISNDVLRMVASFALALILGSLIRKWNKPEEQKYGWQAGENTAGVGQPVPVVYGKMKTYGHVIQSYIETRNDDQWLYALIALSEGEVGKIYADGTDPSTNTVQINDQYAVNYPAGTVETQYRLGTQNQSRISWFNQVRNSRPVGISLNDGMTQVYTTAASDVEDFIVTLTFPSGLFYIDDDGDVENNTVGVALSYRPVGGEWSAEKFFKYEMSKRTRFSRTISKKDLTGSNEPLTPGQYEVRVRRLTEAEATSLWGVVKTIAVKIGGGKDPTWEERIEIVGPPWHRDESSAYEMTFDIVDEISLATATNYPNTALLAVKIKATDLLSGGFPAISVLVDGVKVDTRSGGAWTGKVWSDNPAWIVYDLLTNTRYGLGAYVKPEDIDLESFEAFAAYCDELVDIKDINGNVVGQEKRHRCDIVLDEAEEAWDSIHKILSSCRGLMVDSDSKYRIYPERPEGITQVFTMGNIVKKSFTTHWANIKDEYNVVEAVYYDRDNNFNRCTMRFPASLPAEDAKTLHIELPGVTRYSQAKREAAFRLNLITAISQSIEFDAALDAITCTVGDVIGVAHDLPQWGFSGRVKNINSGATSYITIDRKDVPFEDGKTYEVCLRYPDDTIQTYTVAAASQDTLTINEAVQTYTGDDKDIVYAYGEVEKSIKPFRVVSITLNEDLTRHISAVEYNPAIYEEVEVKESDAPQYSALPNPVVIAPVENLDLVQHEIRTPDNKTQVVIDVSWDIPASSDGVYARGKVYLRKSYELEWRLVGEGHDSFRIPNVAPGIVYEVAVVAVSTLGIAHDIQDAPTLGIEITGKARTLAPVTGFAASSGLGVVHLTWNHSTDPDVIGYEVYMGDSPNFTPDEATFANRVWSGYADKCQVVVAAGETKYFKIRSFDAWGLFSAYSEAVSAAGGGIGADLYPEPPPVPTDLTLSTTSEGAVASITASWTGVDGAVQYEVRLREFGKLEYTYQTTTQTSVLFENLKVGVTYGVAVRAINPIGKASAFCTEVTKVTSGDLTAPEAPTDVLVTPAFAKLIVMWTAPTDKRRVEGYEVHCDTSSGTFTPTDATKKWAGNATIAAVDLGVGASVYVKVVSVSPNGVRSAAVAPDNNVLYSTAAVGTTEISDDAITAPKIAAGAITADHITAGGLDAAVIKTGVLNASVIDVGAIRRPDGTVILPGALTATAAGVAENDATVTLDPGLFGLSRPPRIIASINAIRTYAGGWGGNNQQVHVGATTPMWSGSAWQFRTWGRLVVSGTEYTHNIGAEFDQQYTAALESYTSGDSASGTTRLRVTAHVVLPYSYDLGEYEPYRIGFMAYYRPSGGSWTQFAAVNLGNMSGCVGTAVNLMTPTLPAGVYQLRLVYSSSVNGYSRYGSDGHAYWDAWYDTCDTVVATGSVAWIAIA